MRRLASVAATAVLLLASVASFAFIQPPPDGPGPNGNNEHGLCTAYFNGQKKGHDKQQDKNGEYPGPFQGLADDAGDEHPQSGDNDGDEFDAPEAIFEYCQEYGIGGNPDVSGRFDCEIVESDDPDNEGETEAECSSNDDAPANNGKGNG